MNAWLTRCIRLFQSLGAKYEKVLLPLVDFAIQKKKEKKVN